MIPYQAAFAGIVLADGDEGGISCTGPACGTVRDASGADRGLYRCPRGWTAHADVHGALNLYARAFPVSPVKQSSSRVARPALASFQAGRHTVYEPTRRPNGRASA
jgi:putative transposase